MDPLSDVLSLLRPRSTLAAGFDAGGDWSIAFPRNPGIKCYAVVSGQAWLAVADVADPVRLTAGDCFLLPRGRPFVLASDPALPPVDALALFASARAGGIASYNGGGGFLLVGSQFVLDGPQADMLLEMLPPIVHLRDAADQAALRWSVERMMQELRGRQPGGVLVAQTLAHMMLVQALRCLLADRAQAGVGWLYALADRQIGAAIAALHAEPGRRWTLQDLASQAGMSRSSFALRFRTTVGSAPMDYLTRWRMLLAGDRLSRSAEPVAAIALALGYELESAFSTAFKRVMGCAPRRYGRQEVRAKDAGEARWQAA